MHPSIPLDEAYATLGLEQGADAETVKKAYKEHALRTHPDKASHDQREEATEAFQRVGAAYERITTHIDRQSRGPSASGGFGRHDGGPNVFFTPGGNMFFTPFGSHGGGGQNPFFGDDEDDEYDYDDYDDDEYYDDDDEYGFDQFDFFE